MKKQEMFHAWLNDAYAMEKGKADLLRRYSDDLKEYPDLQEKFAEMAKTAEENGGELKELIEEAGGDTSVVKNTLSKLASVFQSANSELMHDQVVKHMLLTYSGAHLGAASYTALATAAQELGESEVAAFSEESAETALADADWIEERLPSLISEFLEKKHEE
jgi:ferritin-like metal-binding protein YciE